MSGRLTLAACARGLELAAGTPAREGWPASGATAEHLAQINKMPMVLEPLKAEDVFVRGVYALNDQPMHGNLSVETSGVEFVARQARGVPVLCNHDTGFMSGRDALPVGRVFAGEVAREAGATWARLLFWMPATDANAELVQRMDGGAIAENSVSIGYRTTECTVCRGDLWECSHVPGESYGGVLCAGVVRGVEEFYETSLVWAGRAKGTRFFMAAGRDLGSTFDELVARKRKSDGLAALFRREPIDELLRR